MTFISLRVIRISLAIIKQNLKEAGFLTVESMLWDSDLQKRLHTTFGLSLTQMKISFFHSLTVLRWLYILDANEDVSGSISDNYLITDSIHYSVSFQFILDAIKI